VNPAAFQRQQTRIERRFPAGRKRADAIRRLITEAAAAIIIRGGKIVGYRLPSGAAVCIKYRYSSEDLATQDLARIQAASTGHIPTRAYHCERCRGFHLTSQTKRNNSAL
jgi:hypothetical protein